MSYNIIFMAVLGCTLISPSWEYSSGAPEDACVDMTPQHNTSPQTSQAPYDLSVSRKTIRSGDELQFTIKGRRATDTIKGFLIQARQGQEPVGSFKVAPGDSLVQAINCGNGKANAVTHVKHEEDLKNLSVTWISPKDLKGEIKFYATIALNGHEFWVAVPSETIKIY